MNVAAVSAFLREVLQEWSNDNALTLGAALAYYTIFSMAPLLVLAIAVAGLVFGRAAAQGEIVAQIQGVLGPSGAELIESMIERASEPTSGVIATVISLATMFFGASGVFGQLQGSLNQIWGAGHAAPQGREGSAPAPRGELLDDPRHRLPVARLARALGADLRPAPLRSTQYLTGSVGAPVARELRASRSLIVTALFAMIFKLLPDARIEWRDVWLGAAVTALLFTIGKSLIGIYLGRAGVTSVYGAAGSLVLVLLWVYYSSQLLVPRRRVHRGVLATLRLAEGGRVMRSRRRRPRPARARRRLLVPRRRLRAAREGARDEVLARRRGLLQGEPRLGGSRDLHQARDVPLRAARSSRAEQPPEP